MVYRSELRADESSNLKCYLAASGSEELDDEEEEVDQDYEPAGDLWRKVTNARRV